MSSDDLSQTLLGLAAWMSRVAAGTHAMTPEGASAFEAALDKAALQALVLEARRDAFYAARPDTAELHAAIRAGRVLVLPNGPSLCAAYGDVPFSDGHQETDLA